MSSPLSEAPPVSDHPAVASASEDRDREMPAMPEVPMVPRIRVLALGLLAFVGGTSVVCWLDSSHSEPFVGYVEVETSTVCALCDGRIHKVFVRPGMTLNAGASLLTIADEGHAQAVASVRAEVTALKNNLDQARARADVEVAWRIRSLADDEFQAQLQMASCLERRFFGELEDVAYSDLARRKGLQISRKDPDEVFRFASNPVQLSSDLGLVQAMLSQEAAQNEVEVSQAQLELCESRLKELQGLKAALPENVRRAQGIDLAESQLEKASRRLQELESREPLQTVTAPSYGTVALFRAKVSDHVVAGEPLLKLLDEDRRFVTVQIPTRLLPRLKAGTQLQILFPGNQARRGSIDGLPPQTEPCSSDAPTRCAQDSRVTVRVEPAGKIWPDVPIGTAVQIAFLERTSNAE